MPRRPKPRSSSDPRLLAPVRSALGCSEVADGGDRLSAGNQRDFGLTRADGRAELTDEVLRTLAPDDLEDRAGGICADSGGNRSGRSLADLPNGDNEIGVEMSNWRIAARVSIAAPSATESAPESANAFDAASIASASGDNAR